MNVYVIASEGGMCKIGKANDPASRMTTLSTGHPYKLILAHVFPTASESEAYAAEQRAHIALAAKRMNGEWFKVSVEEAISAVDPTYSPPANWDLWNRRRLADAMRGIAVAQIGLADEGMGDGIMKHETLLPTTPWYCTPEALTIIEAIRANPIAPSPKHCWHGDRRDDWQVFEGSLVEALDRLHSAAFHIADTSSEARKALIRSGNVQDVIAAALNTWLPGTHFNSDMARLSGITEAIDCALVAERIAA